MRTIHRSGFTIVELLIAIIVIAILAAISIVAYNGIQNRARASSISSALAQSKKKIALWQVDNGTNSPSCSQFYELMTSTSGSGSGANCSFDVKDVNYQYSNTNNTAAYCITATSGSTSYKASNIMQPTQGGCGGHGQGGQAAITNLIVNPKLAIDNSHYSYAGSVSSVERVPISDLSGFSYAWRANTSVDAGRVFTAQGGAVVTAGQTYTASAWVKLTSSGTNLLLQAADTDGINYKMQNCNAVTGDWQYCSLTFTPTATSLRIAARQSGNGTGQLFLTGVMVTKGSMQYNYADGDATDWAWNGTPNNSTSTGPPF